jgi:hypothetical protein
MAKLYPELATQKALCDWIKLQWPAYAPFIIRITNEGKRSFFSYNALVATGLNPGASDLFIAVPKGIYHGLFVEVKPIGFKEVASNKKHIDRQMKFLDAVRSQGYYGIFGIGIAELIENVDFYFKLKS